MSLIVDAILGVLGNLLAAAIYGWLPRFSVSNRPMGRLKATC
jgi:hypothetical protein